MKPQPKVLRSTLKRPQSVRIRDIKPPPSQQKPSIPLPSNLSNPKQNHKLIIQFAVPEKIVKKSNQPFLWENLVLENTQLSNKINQLKKENEQLRDTISQLKQQLIKVIKLSQQENEYNDQELSREKHKSKNFKKSLANLRLKQSQLKHQIQLFEEEKKMTQQQFMITKHKQSQFGETKMKLYELKQQNRFLNKKVTDNFKEMIQRKFPHYCSTIFSSLNIFKRLQRIQLLPPSQKLPQLINFTIKPLVDISKTFYSSVKDWIKYSFFGKCAYHPSNSQLIQAMLDKWRNSNKLVEQLQDKSKKIFKMQQNSIRMIDTIQKHQEYITQLEILNENVRFRNQRLEEMFEVKMKEFMGGLMGKLRRHEEEMRVGEEMREKEWSELGVLVNPEYMKLKEIMGLIDEKIDDNRKNRANISTINQLSPSQLLPQPYSPSPLHDSTLYDLKSLTQTQKQRRQVIILKKNVYGYWIDPNFTHSIPRIKKPYQKYHHKATQTVTEIELTRRLFFNILLLKAKFRSISLKLDPYVKLEYSSNTYKSSVRSGKTPQWHQPFTFQMKQTSMLLTIYDKQKLRRDDVIGSCTANFTKIFQNNSSQQIRIQLQIKDQKGEFIGTLWLGVWMLKQQQVIHIRQIQGNFLKQKDLLSEMDPYVVFKLDERVVDQTEVKRKGGVRPIWREEFMLYVREEEKVFAVEVKEEDVMVDDLVGVGKMDVNQIKGKQEEVVVQLFEDGEEEQNKRGTIKFKIYRHTYINDSIKQKQPVLIPLTIIPSRFFMISNTRLSLNTTLPLSLFIHTTYSSLTIPSITSSGKQLFFPQSSIFKISPSHHITFRVFQKTMLGNVKELLKFEYDAKEMIQNNYEDVESVKEGNGVVEVGSRVRMLDSVEVVFVKGVRVEMVKQIMKEIVVEVKMGEIVKRYVLREESGYLQGVLEDDQIYYDKDYKSLQIRLLSQQKQLSKTTLLKSSILPDFYTQLSLPLLSPKSIFIAHLTLTLARHKFTNTLTQKIKKLVLTVENREYYTLFAHKALLTRSTELIGEMNCYLLMEYVKEMRTRESKGKRPIWNQHFIVYEEKGKEFKYSVMDKESVLKDDLVGSGTLDLPSILKTHNQQQPIIGDLTHKSSPCGQVFFSLTPIPLQPVIFISLLRAEIHEDTDWFSKIDPYATISQNKVQVYKTGILSNKGQNPEWMLSVEVELTDGKQGIEVKLYDEDVVSQDYLGVAEFEREKFKGEYEEISAELVKDGKRCGTVYLTAARKDFINPKFKPKPPKSPSLFSSLHLLKFTLLSLTTNQPQRYLLKYQYPFPKQTPPTNQKSLYHYCNYQQYLNYNGVLLLEIHKPNLVGNYEFKYNVKVEMGLKDEESFRVGEMKLLNTKGKEIGVGRYAVERVYQCWVIAVSRLKLRLNEGIDSDITLTFHSSIDSYSLSYSQSSSLNSLILHDFHFYTAQPAFHLTIFQKSLFSQQLLGTTNIDVSIVNNEFLEWRDIEVEGVGMVEVECARVKYERGFNFTCWERKQEGKKGQKINIKKYFSESWMKKEEKMKNGEWLENEQKTWKIDIKDEQINLCVDQLQLVRFQSSIYQIQPSIKQTQTKPNYVFLKHNKKRIGIITCDSKSSDKIENGKNEKMIQLKIKDFRIKWSEDEKEVSCLASGREYLLKNKIGEYWYCEKMRGFVGQNQKYFIQVKSSQGQLIKMQLEYKQQCYFQNQIKHKDYIVYYSITPSPYLPSPPILLTPPTSTSSLKLFSITSLSLETQTNIGSGFLSLIYSDKQYKFNIMNCNTTYQLSNNNTLIFQVSESDVIDLSVESKIKGTARLSIERFLGEERLGERVVEGEIKEGGVTIGIVRMKLKYLEEWMIRKIRLERVFVANEYQDVRVRVESGGEKYEAALSLEDGVSPKHQDITIFSRQPIYLYLSSSNKPLGQSLLPSSPFTLLLQSSQLNALLIGSTYSVTNHHSYSLQQPQTQIQKPHKQLFEVTIEQIFVEDCEGDRVYFAVSGESVFYSEFYEVGKGGYGRCVFSFLVEEIGVGKNIKMELWKREMGGDKMLGQSSFLLSSSPKSLEFTLKNNVTALSLLSIRPSPLLSSSYYSISKISASNLRDTELLVEMKPYVIIQHSKYCYRTSVGVGKEKLNWVTGGLIVIEGETVKIKIMDRDLKYDDEVGEVEIDMGKKKEKEDNGGKYELRHKGKVAGVVEIAWEKMQIGKLNKDMKQNIKKEENQIEPITCLNIQILQIENVSSKLLLLSPYLKIIHQSNILYQLPISSTTTLTFNKSISFPSPVCPLQIQLCSKPPNKQQKIHSQLSLPLQSVQKTQIPLPSLTNQQPQQLTYSISNIQRDLIKIDDAKIFTPNQNPSSKKSFIIVTTTQYYRSRQLNSSDNKIIFYDDIYLSSLPSSTTILIFTNTTKLIGRCILKDFNSKENQLICQIISDKFESVGLLQLNYNIVSSQGVTLSKMEQSFKCWYVMKIISAKMLRDVELLSKMDLYCKIEGNGGKCYQTKVLEDIGMEAEWNQMLIVEKGDEQRYTIGVWDSEILKDRIVGSSQLILTQYSQNQQHTVALNYKQTLAGHLSFSYFSLSSYIRFSNFSPIFPNKIDKIVIKSEDREWFKSDDLKEMERLIVEIPLISENLVIKVNDKKGKTVDVKMMRESEVYSCVVDDVLVFEYRIFN